MNTASFGRTELPEEQAKALRRAVRVAWITIATLVVTVTLVGLTAGQSQAMKTAFMEDMLAFLPPIAFLVAVHRARRRPDPKHPYGHHRAVGAAHLVASVALLGMGVWLAVEAGSGLVAGDRPPIGITTVFGQTFWAGWLMMAVMAVTCVPAVVLGHIKHQLARPLHDKVLAADADMNKADWTSALATIAGVAGIGFGLWWADAAAALVVSVSIVKDGVTNLRRAVADLLDARATTIDGEPHPVLADLLAEALGTAWVSDAAVRVRDEGHVFHSEVFVVPEPDVDPTVDAVEDLRRRAAALDWKTADTVVAVVRELPAGLSDQPSTSGTNT